MQLHVRMTHLYEWIFYLNTLPYLVLDSYFSWIGYPHILDYRPGGVPGRAFGSFHARFPCPAPFTSCQLLVKKLDFERSDMASSLNCGR